LLNIVDIFTFYKVNLTVLLRLIRGCNGHGQTFRTGRKRERWRSGRDYKRVVGSDGGGGGSSGIGFGGGIGVLLPPLGSWRGGGRGIGCRW